MRLLTQNRKGHGKQIVGTAQRFIRVDKVIRELCTHVVECHTLLGRWTFQKRYDAEDYEEMLHQVDVVKNTKSLVGVLLLSSPTHCENLMILSRCWNLQRQKSMLLLQRNLVWRMPKRWRNYKYSISLG